MKKKLLIVESPTKVKTISGFLGSDYTVNSSKGHIFELIKKGEDSLGIDFETITPNYKLIPNKEATVKSLISSAKSAEMIFLATDPDREGEAISNDILTAIKPSISEDTQIYRISFNEITASAVKAALEHPRDIDENLVNSQKSRRMLDRILGFLVSSFLQKKIKSRSAGRVQSVALKQIADLQKIINAFQTETYYVIEAELFKGIIFTLNKYKNKKIVVRDSTMLAEIKGLLESGIPFKIANIKKANRVLNPYIPLTTTKLLQSASSSLGYSISNTTRLAQQLYEGVEINGKSTSLITYLRTDSTRLSHQFISHALSFVKQNYPDIALNQYIVTKQSKKTLVQDAHEAIRPVNFRYHYDEIKSHLTSQQYYLYRLIYLHTLTCFCKSPTLNTIMINLQLNDYLFTRLDNFVVEKGYYAILGIDKAVVNGNLFVQEHNWSNLNQPALSYNIIEKQTKPPAMFSEARLIKKMDDLEIGRPSTYSGIIQRLIDSSYCVIEDKKINLTRRGELTNDVLQISFNKVINEDFTANVEHTLDLIATGKEDYHQFVSTFYKVVKELVNLADKITSKHQGFKLDRQCEQCDSGQLLVKSGRYGEFIGCSNYPNCKFTEKIVKEIVQEIPEINKLSELNCMCFKCKNGLLLIRQSSKRKSVSYFVGCSNYPQCRLLISLNDQVKAIINQSPDEVDASKALFNYFTNAMIDKKIDVTCPLCKKANLVYKFSARTKQKFIGCSNYPKCKNLYSISCQIKKEKPEKTKASKKSN